MNLHRPGAPQSHGAPWHAAVTFGPANMHHHGDNTVTLCLPSAVIIDMDGTLVLHRHPRMLAILERLQTTAGAIGRHMPRRPAKPASATIRTPRLYGHRMLHKLRRRDVQRIVRPAAGAETFLRLLQTCNIPAGLASNGLGQGYGRNILAAYNLGRFFDKAVFREDVLRPKPEPDALLKVIALMKLPAHKDTVIWYIGDQAKDVAAVRSAATHSDYFWQAILFCAAGSPPSTAQHSADHCFQNWSELTALLSMITGQARSLPSTHQI